jgi:hypothetical protein
MSQWKMNDERGKKRGIWRINYFVGKCESKRQLGRSRRRWKVNVKMEVKELGREDADWIKQAQREILGRVL